tara:strand:- start:9057 stop:9335 length:279 start_codon:yes stop_codon:yes gene_type:complete
MVSVQQARHCQRYVQHMLGIMILYVTGSKAGVAAAVKAIEIPEKALQGIHVEGRIASREQRSGNRKYIFCIGNVYRVAHIHMTRALKLTHTV